MVRRHLTVKRIDPWSVLKLGMLANLALLGIGMLTAGVAWFVIARLELITRFCELASDIGFRGCQPEAGQVFRALLLLGLLWVVIQTAVLVFLSFLHNLLADLTGGLTISVADDTPGSAARGEAPARSTTTGLSSDRSSSQGASTRPRRAGAPPVPPIGTERNAPVGRAEPGRTGGDELFGERRGR